jgi:hypothetical protein
MPTKADILMKYAKKHDVSVSLLSEVFEIERARLHPGEAEARYRQEEIRNLLRKWIEDRSEGDKR